MERDNLNKGGNGWRARFFGGTDHTLKGHAGLLARPAYQRLLQAEPLFRRSIPILITIFIVVVGVAHVSNLMDRREETERSARDALSLVG